MKRTLIATIILLSSTCTVLLLEAPIQTKTIFVIALLICTTISSIVYIFQANNERVLNSNNISEKFTKTDKMVEESISKLRHKIAVYSVHIEKHLNKSLKELLNQLSRETIQIHDSVNNRILQLESELKLLKELSLTGNEHQEKNLQSYLNELGNLRQDLSMEILQASAVTNEALISVGGACTAQNQTFASLLSHPSQNANFGVEQWDFHDGNISKSYTPGRLLEVTNNETDTTTTFNYNEENKTVTSNVFSDGVLRYRTLSSFLGTPIQGWEYDKNGNIKVEYCYNDKGQLTNRNSG